MASVPLSIFGSCIEYCLNPRHLRAETRRGCSLPSDPAERCGGDQNSPPAAASTGKPGWECESLRTSVTSSTRSGPAGQNHEDPQHLDCTNRRRLPTADELLCTIGTKKFVMTGIEMLSVVALLEDLPEEGWSAARLAL